MKKEISTELKWKLAIDQAKQTLSKAHNHQMQIAELALSVCEITHGGASKSYKDKYTLTRFAKEIGMNWRTLSNWVGIRRLVYERLSPLQKKEAQFSEMIFVSRSVNKKTPRAKVQKIYQDHLECDTFERKIIRYVCDLRSLHFNFEKKAAAFKLSDPLLKEILFFIRKIDERIREDRPMILPQITGATIRVRSSAANAVVGKRVKPNELYSKEV